MLKNNNDRLFFHDGDLWPLYSYIQKETSLPKKGEHDVVFQYTSWESLFNGIVRRGNDGYAYICLRATNCQYLNDPGEIQYGRDVATKCIFPYFKDIAPEELLHLDYNNVYITSFSYVINGLPMWKMYGNDGYGLALGFDMALIQSPGRKLYKCIYDDVDFRSTIQQLMGQCLRSNTKKGNSLYGFQGYLMKLQKLVKHVAYRHEEECRLVSVTEESPQFRTDHDKLIPFIENHFPIEALKVIWIGPKCNPEQAVSSLMQWLDYMRLQDVKIMISDIPYR